MNRTAPGGRRLRLLALAPPLVLTAVLTPVLAARNAAEPASAATTAATAQTGPPGAGEAEGDDTRPPAEPDADLLARGEELYLTGCSSCHGPDGGGVQGPDGDVRGPSLETAGEATAYYYLATGRMPLANSEDEAVRKEPAYDDDEIDALVAYVGSLGDGPEIPELDRDADLAAGGEVFRGNCQPCHSASGSGGALSYAQAAPRLAPATPLEIASAVRSGPGQMPAFSGRTISDRQLADLVRYVEYLDDPADPGGVPIGRTGPIPEGFVAWLLGMVVLLAFVVWIGTRSPIRRRSG